jgi:hypothetical protein
MPDDDNKSKNGSETRRRTRIIGFRATPAEHAEIEAKAERSGVFVSSYVRAAVLNAPITRAARRPTVEVQAITRLQGEMNKVGSNIHQILRRANFGESPLADEYQQALEGYREVIAAILAALGRGQGRA